MTKTLLTGIKPTGNPHLGNYFGTIAPTLRLANEYDESFLFIANYHALNQVQNAEELERLTLEVAAAWLACGLDPSRMNIYTQSDLPEVFELETILNSFTPKGWMNKAHAYKAAVDRNTEENRPSDDGINMGLYTYPILMAADILLFNPTTVPVGNDQIQHVEIARDIAQRINSHYSQELFALPAYRIEEGVGTIPGVDGRKMSKSYDNVVQIFASPEERQKQINSIVTDSSNPEDPKQAEGSAIYEIYRLIANEEEAQSFKSRLEQGGMGWGDAKRELGEKVNAHFEPITQEYNRLMANPEEIKSILSEGANKVRPIATKHIMQLRTAMGII